MTILLATIATSTAWLTTDSAMVEVDAAAPMPTAGTTTTPVSPTATAGHPGRIVGTMVRKTLVLPDRRIALAGTGQRLLLTLLQGDIATGTLPGGFDELLVEIPDYLRTAAQLLPGYGNLAVVLVGWSARERRALGAAFTTADGFEPVLVRARHIYQPTPAQQAPDYARVQLLSARAALGHLVEDFHLEMAQAQLWSARHGYLPDGFNAGGPLMCARVDQQGASQRQIADLGLAGEVRAA